MTGPLDRPPYTPVPPMTGVGGGVGTEPGKAAAGGLTIDPTVWAYRELRSVAQVLAKPPGWYLDVVSAAPTRPRVGLLAYADGVNWNPGSGEGLYVYTSGGWVKVEGLGWLSVRGFGAKGDGLANDTQAIQNALNAAATGRPSATVYFPAGTYAISAALVITAQCTLVGDGAAISVIEPAVSIDGIDINTQLPVTVERLGIFYPSAANAGTNAIAVSGSGQGNSSSTFRDIQLLNCAIGINFIQAVAFVVDNAKIEQVSNSGIAVQNTTNPDAGDSIIANCYIQGTVGVTFAAIHWLSEGALRVTNNTLINTQYGLVATLAAGVVTRQMVISNNSFDGQSAASIAFTRAGTSGSFGGVVIEGNIFNLSMIGVFVPVDAAGAWLTGVNIVGNNYYDAGGAGNYFVNISSTNGLVVGYNTSQATVPTTVNIFTGASVNGAVIGPNMKVGTFAANSIGGTGVTVIAPN